GVVVQQLHQKLPEWAEWLVTTVAVVHRCIHLSIRSALRPVQHHRDHFGTKRLVTLLPEVRKRAAELPAQSLNGLQFRLALPRKQAERSHLLASPHVSEQPGGDLAAVAFGFDASDAREA